MPPTMIDEKEYEDSIKGCSKGINVCDKEYKENMKYYRTQFKNKNTEFINENGKMIRPKQCRICTAAKDFIKSTEIQYENNFYGYAREKETGQSIYFHWSKNFNPNFGISKVVRDGRLVPRGISDFKSYKELFKLTCKSDNQKVQTPKIDEFISGIIEENKFGHYEGKCQWTKWFRHSLTFVNWVKYTKNALEKKQYQYLLTQPKLLISKVIYDQNMLLPEMSNYRKTPCNCENISREHFILAAVTMVSLFGIRPKNRNIFEEYGGMSKVGKLNFFTFLEHINDFTKLKELSSKSNDEIAIDVTLHSSDFNANDTEFWSKVSSKLKFTNKKFEKHYERHINYEYYKDYHSVEHLPYYNQVPYYNSINAYDASYYGYDNLPGPLYTENRYADYNQYSDSRQNGSRYEDRNSDNRFEQVCF
tara:strand:+ start:4206 stop:5462 length:1257 start_codon:yes stop_codon:yes gene_type:complete